jgi:hypothetical protein
VAPTVRPGPRAWAYGQWAGPCGRVPGLGRAVRLAAVYGEPEWWLRLPNLQPRQRRARLGRHAAHQVGLQAEPPASGAAGRAYQPAVPTGRPDLSWRWMCSTHRVWLAAAVWESPEIAAQAQRPGRSQAARPSFQTRGGSEGLAWALEAAADPILVRHLEQAVQWEALKAEASDYEAPAERKFSEPGRRSAAAVVAEPAATAPAAAAVLAEPAATAPAAAESSLAHPGSVGSAVEGPVFAESAAPVHFSGGSAECSGTLRQRQAAGGRQIQEAGRCCWHQPLSRERLGLHAPPAALHGLLCSGRSTSLGPEHSRRAHLDALPRSPRRG